MNEKSERKRVWKGGKKNLPFYIISTIVLFIFGIVFVCGYTDLWYVKDNVDFKHPVEATITDLRAHSSGTDGLYWYSLFYEYTSFDGTYYCGDIGYYNSRETATAELNIGDKVQIYIDGHGKSVPSDAYRNTPNLWVLIVGVVCLIAGLAVFIILVIPHKWQYK